MGTTIEDIYHEEYLEDLHKSYINALEKFAFSRNILELRENLDGLQNIRASIEDWMTNTKGEDFEKLEQTLSEITGLENIYSLLVLEGKKSRRYFWVGVILSIAGIFLSIFSLFI